MSSQDRRKDITFRLSFQSYAKPWHLQALRLSGSGVLIVKEIPKNKDLFYQMDIPYPKKIVKN